MGNVENAQELQFVNPRKVRVFLRPQKLGWVDSTLMFRKRCDDQYNALRV